VKLDLSDAAIDDIDPSYDYCDIREHKFFIKAGVVIDFSNKNPVFFILICHTFEARHSVVFVEATSHSSLAD
jgi:hypothetical protein